MRYADKHMQLVHVHAAMQRMQDVLDGAMNSGVQHDARRNAGWLLDLALEISETDSVCG